MWVSPDLGGTAPCLSWKLIQLRISAATLTESPRASPHIPHPQTLLNSTFYCSTAEAAVGWHTSAAVSACKALHQTHGAERWQCHDLAPCAWIHACSDTLTPPKLRF
jgi:hypothetical protein